VERTAAVPLSVYYILAVPLNESDKSMPAQHSPLGRHNSKIYGYSIGFFRHSQGKKTG